MTRREFERIMEEAVASLPEPLRHRIENVHFRIAESPNRRQARPSTAGGRVPSLYGLYEGIPFGDRGSEYDAAVPDKITLFKRAIERDCKTREARVRCIQETVLHEIGHFFGMDDRQLDKLGIG